mmetsp:Transcript_6931/g.18724  ORF Transcript_6931/g.18724 Transcript_6931/m.18724 type:complete len:264 (-) Transcript_6931:157-948(-)
MRPSLAWTLPLPRILRRGFQRQGRDDKDSEVQGRDRSPVHGQAVEPGRRGVARLPFCAAHAGAAAPPGPRDLRRGDVCVAAGRPDAAPRRLVPGVQEAHVRGHGVWHIGGDPQQESRQRLHPQRRQAPRRRHDGDLAVAVQQGGSCEAGFPSVARVSEHPGFVRYGREHVQILRARAAPGLDAHPDPCGRRSRLRVSTRCARVVSPARSVSLSAGFAASCEEWSLGEGQRTAVLCSAWACAVDRRRPWHESRRAGQCGRRRRR